MIDQNKIYKYRILVTNRFNTQEAYTVFMRFMCHCLEAIQEFLPTVGKVAFEKAKEHWIEGIDHTNDLEALRIICWQYLDNKGGRIDIKDKEDASMRALLCVLHTKIENEDFSSDTIEWFTDMLDRLGDYSSEVERHMVC